MSSKALIGSVGAAWVCGMLLAADRPAGSGKPEWNRFRGPNGSGVTEAGPLPAEFGPDKNVRWAVELPRGVSSPCVWGDRIFLTGFNEAKHTLETFCLDRANGEILWRRAAAAEQIEKVHEVSSPANATPTTDGERVYVYFGSLGLVCYDFAGNLLWKQPLPTPSGNFGTGTSPVLAADVLVLVSDSFSGGFGIKVENPQESFILAVDRRTGEIVWKTPRQGRMPVYPTPVHVQSDDTDQILVFSSGRLTAYSTQDGRELWWVNNLPLQTCASPVLGGDCVYFSGTGMFGEPSSLVELPDYTELVKRYDKDGDGVVAIEEIPEDLLLVDRKMSGGAGNSTVRQFVAFADEDKDGKLTKAEWEKFVQLTSQFIKGASTAVYAVRLGGEGDVTGTNVVWSDGHGVPEVPCPLYYNGRVFLVKNGGIVFCRDAETGKVLYRGRLGQAAGYYSSPVAADGKIYTASDTGGVVVLDADSEELDIIASNDLGERIIATPALVGDTIYIRTDSRLYAFGQE